MFLAVYDDLLRTRPVLAGQRYFIPSGGDACGQWPFAGNRKGQFSIFDKGGQVAHAHQLNGHGISTLAEVLPAALLRLGEIRLGEGHSGQKLAFLG